MDTPLDAMEVKTREQAYPFIERQRLRCAGNISVEDRKIAADLRSEGKIAESDEYEHTHRGIKQEGPYGTSFAPCGFDMGVIVEAGALDGRDYLATCPRCKVEFSYKAPWFPALAPDGRQATEHEYDIRPDLRYMPTWMQREEDKKEAKEEDAVE